MISKYIQAIIDVPTRQTDQPFLYEIPDSLANQVEIGMRVDVPFGNGNRHVMGVVIELLEKIPENLLGIQIRQIRQVLDLTPVLNAEQIQMVDVISEQTFAFKINVIKAMLPNVLNAKYSKIIEKIDELEEDDEQKIFNGAEEADFEDKANQYSLLIKKLISQKKVAIRYELNGKSLHKTEIVLSPKKNIVELEAIKSDIAKNAAKQKELIELLQQSIDSGVKVSLKQAQKKYKINAQTISLAQKNEWLLKTKQIVQRNPIDYSQITASSPLELNEQQTVVFDQVAQSIKNNQTKTFLLEGITGSGKTEVYLQLIQEALLENKTALILVPEITLTSQISKRLVARFGKEVALLHSALSDGERFDEWQRVLDGNVKIVVGTRSTVFLPLQNISLIIIDEEHDQSYKQETNPRYHTRDVAMWRAKFHNAALVLGSATPSLESRARAQRGVYQLLTLTKRAVENASLPQVQIVDMRDVVRNSSETDISPVLLERIKERINKKEQIILLINRRGYSSFAMCRNCGFIPRDPNCNLPMTVHLEDHQLKCHYCGYSTEIPTTCEVCGSNRIGYYGTGTQKVANELTKLIPDAKILRLDQDTTSKKGSADEILTSFEQQEADILLGTQMVAKGLDFKNVTLVGVINADTSLGLPDFRSSEKTFQLLSQVAGRAGRGSKEGEVLIQTFNPDNYAISFAQKHDYEHFYQQEMSIRHLGNYSPYFYTLRIVVSHQQEEVAAKKIYEIKKRLSGEIDNNSIVLGPSPSPLAKLKNKYFYQIIIKYKTDKKLSPKLKLLQEEIQSEEKKGLQLVIDREPQSFM